MFHGGAVAAAICRSFHGGWERLGGAWGLGFSALGFRVGGLGVEGSRGLGFIDVEVCRGKGIQV